MDYLTIYYKNLSEQLQSQASLLEQKINIMKKLYEGPTSEWEQANFNIDDYVDAADLGVLLGNWGQNGIGDLDGDGIVTSQDLGRLLGSWGSNPANNTIPTTPPNVDPKYWDNDYYSTLYPFRRSVKGKSSFKKK